VIVKAFSMVEFALAIRSRPFLGITAGRNHQEIFHMPRIISTLAATTALALAAFAVPSVPASAAGPFDGTWIIDVPSDVVAGTDGDPTCPALRLKVQISDNRISGDWRRSPPEASNVVADGGHNPASRVGGNVQADGRLTAQWQNFHAAGQMSANDGALTMQSECGPLIAHAWRLDESTVVTTATSSSGMQTVSSTTTGQQNGYNVYFSFDKSRLTFEGQRVVDSAVSATRGDRTSRIALVGKADLSGTDPYNMALSERRAARVRNAMIAGGVPANRIDVTWVGEREPPVPTAQGVRQAQNRVVEVAIR
jgi:outer membrane protein OmpA-like peptidoglycan-associated protein